MTFFSDAKIIEERFNTEWTALGNGVPIRWGNQSGEIPDDEFVRITVDPADTSIASLNPPGSRRYRNVGDVIVQVFTQIGTGEGRGRNLADDVAEIFRGITVSGIIFYAPSLVRIGDDGRFFQHNVITEYQSDFED